MRTLVVSKSDPIQPALSQLEKTGGSLFIEPGFRSINEKLRYASDKPVSIKGAGSGVTQLFFDGETAGFDITVEDDFETGGITFEGIGLHPKDYVSEAGLTLRSIDQRGGPKPGSNIRDVVVGPLPGRHRRSSGFEQAGIRLVNQTFARVDGCFVYGVIEGPCYELLGDCTPGPVFTACRGYYSRVFASKGVSSADTTEGGHFVHCIGVNNRWGIWWECLAGEPGLQVDGGHYSNEQSNIYLGEAHQASIRGALFYRRRDVETAEYVDIDARDCVSLVVADNIAALKGDGRSAVLSAQDCREIVVANNIVQGNSRDAHFMDAGGNSEVILGKGQTMVAG